MISVASVVSRDSSHNHNAKPHRSQLSTLCGSTRKTHSVININKASCAARSAPPHAAARAAHQEPALRSEMDEHAHPPAKPKRHANKSGRLHEHDDATTRERPHSRPQHAAGMKRASPQYWQHTCHGSPWEPMGA